MEERLSGLESLDQIRAQLVLDRAMRIATLPKFTQRFGTVD
jgi:hypothetical protein